MNERDATLLNDFYNGLLSDEDARQVQNRASSDPDFGREFTLRADMENFVQRDKQRNAFEQNLNNLGQEFFQQDNQQGAAPVMTAKVNWGRRLAAAAGVALLLAAYWLFSKPGVPEYRQYAQHSPLSFTVRGNSNPEETAAQKAFNSHDYAGALTALETLLNANPGDGTYRLNKGICLIELNRTDEARNTLQTLAEGNTALRGEARWYVALSYLKDKNYQACATAIQRIEDGEDRYKEAQKLLKELPK